MAKTQAPNTGRTEEDALFSPAGTAVCPICWSRPDVKGRVRSGADARVGHEDVGDERYIYTELIYPCSNPTCLTDIVVRAVPGYYASDSVAILGGRSMTEEEEEKFIGGIVGPDGVWRAEAILHVAPATPPALPKIGRRKHR